jgi:hypothetical protein
MSNRDDRPWCAHGAALALVEIRFAFPFFTNHKSQTMRWMYRLVASCSALAMCTLTLPSQQAVAQCTDGCCRGGRQSSPGPQTFADDSYRYDGARYGSRARRSASPYDQGGHNPTGNGGCSCGQSHAHQAPADGGPWAGRSSQGPAWSPLSGPHRSRSAPRSQTSGRGPYRDSDAPMGPPPRGYGYPPRLTPGLGRW